MKNSDVDPWLLATFEDHRLSRSERRSVVDEVMSRQLATRDGLAYVRHRAFAIAKEGALSGAEVAEVLDWLEGVVKTLAALAEGDEEQPARRGTVHFSPGEACRRALLAQLRNARKEVDVCVFTLTDDKLTSAIVDVHRRGVAVRVITDDDKSLDRGSDVVRLLDLGIAVRMDSSEHHMHHKFAVFDRRVVATGSYNWTRSAAEANRENLAVTDDPFLVADYQGAFDQLWRDFEG